MPRRLRFNAFTMNCASHIHPDSGGALTPVSSTTST